MLAEFTFGTLALTMLPNTFIFVSKTFLISHTRYKQAH